MLFRYRQKKVVYLVIMQIRVDAHNQVLALHNYRLSAGSSFIYDIPLLPNVDVNQSAPEMSSDYIRQRS